MYFAISCEASGLQQAVVLETLNKGRKSRILVHAKPWARKGGWLGGGNLEDLKTLDILSDLPNDYLYMPRYLC